jgi:hypothetical protein
MLNKLSEGRGRAMILGTDEVIYIGSTISTRTKEVLDWVVDFTARADL